MGSMGRIGWALAPLTTGALALGVLGAGPGSASNEADQRDATAKTQGTWGTPIRLGNATLGEPPAANTGEKSTDVGVAMDGDGNAIAISAFDVIPTVDAQGESNGNNQGSLVSRYVNGTWQEPEVIAAPMSASGYITMAGTPTVAVSEDGYGAVAVAGEYRDADYNRRYGLFLSTSHDITKAGSFTPWTVAAAPLDTFGRSALTLHPRIPLAVGKGGNLIFGYHVLTSGWPHPDFGETPCLGGSYAQSGKISDGRFTVSAPRVMNRCDLRIGYLDRAPLDVAISGNTATVAYQEGERGCAMRGSTPIDCTQVVMTTLDLPSGSWSSPVLVLPQSPLEVLNEATGVWEPTFSYEHVRVAASAAGTAVVSRINVGSNIWHAYYNNVPAGTRPDVSKAGQLSSQGASSSSTTSYFLSDVVMGADGTALAAFEVETCDVWVYTSCAEKYQRSFQVLEFTPTTFQLHELTPAVTTNWVSRYSNRIAMSLPPGESSLSRVVIAYTATAALDANGLLGPGWIETRAWPFDASSPERLPAPKGYGTALGAWPWSGPAVAAASTGAGLVLYRPDWEASDGIGLQAASEVWASGLNTANRAGLFPPVHVKASVGVDKRAIVTGIRPFFYPEGGGEEAFFNRGAQPRAKMEVLVATGPAGYRVTDTPVCTTTYSQDGSASNRIGSIRGSGSCTITAALPSGTYTFVARTTLDGQTSTRSAPTAPITYTAPAAQQTITLTQLKAIGKGARVKFQIKGTATGFTDGDSLKIWRKVGSADGFTPFNFTISLGKPDRQGKQAFTYTTKGKYLKPISIFVSSSNGGVRSTTRTIQ